MNNAERHRLITSTVRDAGTASVQQLAELSGSSTMTIRRDLDQLAGQGVLERVRGGARSLLLRGEEPPFALRSTEATGAKRAIAESLVSDLPDGSTVLLDSGTTCLEVARLLAGRELSVMAMSLQSVGVLSAPGARCTLFVPGGQPRASEGSLVGPLALASVGALRFDVAILGCCGLDAQNGLTAYDLDDATVKKAALAASARVVLGADGSKIGRTARASVAPADRFDLVVTDASAPEDGLSALDRAGCPIRVAEPLEA